MINTCLGPLPTKHAQTSNSHKERRKMKNIYEAFVSFFKKLFDGIAEARMAQVQEMIRTRQFYWE